MIATGRPCRFIHLLALRRVLDGRAGVPKRKPRPWAKFWGRPDWVIVDAAIEAGIDPRVALNAMGLYVS